MPQFQRFRVRATAHHGGDRRQSRERLPSWLHRKERPRSGRDRRGRANARSSLASRSDRHRAGHHEDGWVRRRASADILPASAAIQVFRNKNRKHEGSRGEEKEVEHSRSLEDIFPGNQKRILCCTATRDIEQQSKQRKQKRSSQRKRTSKSEKGLRMKERKYGRKGRSKRKGQ